jgi:hypothetical protein
VTSLIRSKARLTRVVRMRAGAKPKKQYPKAKVAKARQPH